MAEICVRIVLITSNKNELCKPTIRPDIAVHADVKTFLIHMNQYLDEGNVLTECINPQWLSWCKDINAKYPAVREAYYNCDKFSPTEERNWNDLSNSLFNTLFVYKE